MISIIVYGRNDNYGYNLHKRAAISLNCLAELLNQPNDELVFVDYNTPDDLPTFPEAIADTLTETTRSVMRVLRARPSIHARYAGRTRLMALEAVARNIGLRRSNPANRWVLSTNTDIILVLRRARDLADLTADLPSGFYHTARFEIPESLWESFDRTDPLRTIDDVRALGRTARLNEVVYGSDTILFDGPGDFQLAERETLFTIDGFDERMIRAWHLDSNLAKRLTLQCGPVRSLLTEVYCYHCDHTRQATPAHALDNAGNDIGLFVDGITRSDLPGQRESWGCATDKIEEVRLTQSGRSGYRAVLDALISPLDADFTESFYTPDTYNHSHYDAQHVLPFLADLLNSASRDTRIAWCGTRCDAFKLFCRAWSELGFRRPIAVHRSTERYLLGGPVEVIEVLDQEAWLTEADVFAFDFGLPEDSGLAVGAAQTENAAGPAWESLAIVEAAFLTAVTAERRQRTARPDVLPRRFVGINCIHNRFEALFSGHIAASLTPFGSHLRQGFLADRGYGPDPQTTLGVLIGHALGRLQPITPAELAFAEDSFGPLLRDEPLSPEQQQRAGRYASLGHAFLAAQKERKNGSPISDTLARAHAVLERVRPSTSITPRLGLDVSEGRFALGSARPLSRFACCEDWDDESWSIFARQYITAPGGNDTYREGSPRWEQVHLLYALDRLDLDQKARVLVIATMPDKAIAALSRQTERVEIFSLCADASVENINARAFWCHDAAYLPEALQILAPGTRIEELEHAAYDAVIFPHGAMFGGGLDGALAWMRAAEALLRPNGVLAFKAEIAAGARPDLRHLDTRAVADDGLPAQLARCTAFSMPGGFDARLSLTTVDKIWPEDGPVAEEAYFLSREADRILIPSYWFLLKEETPDRSRWDQVQQWVEQRWLGEHLPGLLTGPAGKRDEDGRIVSLPEQQGHVFFGPYLPVPAGEYRAVLHLRVEDSASRMHPRGVLDAAVGETVVAAKRITAADLKTGSVSLDFAVDPPPNERLPLLEIRLASAGGLTVTVEKLELELREPYRLGDLPGLPVALGRPAAGGCRTAAAGEEGRGETAPAARGRPAPAEGPEGETDETKLDSRLAAAGIDRPAINGTPERLAMTTSEGPRLGDGPESIARPLSRTMAAEDWDDPNWARFLEPDGISGGDRSDAGQWERTHFLYGLGRCGKLSGSSRILVPATMPDELIGLLSEHAARVEVLGLRSDAPERPAAARLFWSNGGLYARDRLTILHGTADELQEGAYHAVVFPHGAICCAGVAGMARLMERAEQLLASDGVLAFKADILAGGLPDPDRLDSALVGEHGLIERVENETGFVIEGEFEAHFPWETSEGSNNESGGDFLRNPQGRPAVPSLWFLRKRGSAARGGWDRIEEWLAERLLGDQLQGLQVGPAGRRDEIGRIVANPSAKGCVFFGPYLVLPRGRYEAVVEIEPLSAPKRGRFVVDVAVGGKRLHHRDVRLAGTNRIVEHLPFELAAPSLGCVEKVEIRGWSNGCPAAVSACRLVASAH